jgi:hypothetical protein
VPQRFVIPAFADMEIDVAKLGCEVQAEFIATASMRLDNGPRRLILYSATVADAKLMAGDFDGSRVCTQWDESRSTCTYRLNYCRRERKYAPMGW